MTRGTWNVHEITLPRAREKTPEGLGSKFLWKGKREQSKSEALLQLLMPNEYARVEKLRKMKRERILGPITGGGAGLAAGAAVLEAMDEAGVESIEPAAEEEAEQEANAQENAGGSAGRRDDGTPEEANTTNNGDVGEHADAGAAPTSDAADDPAPDPAADLAPGSPPTQASSTHSNPLPPSAGPPAPAAEDLSSAQEPRQPLPPDDVAEHRSSYTLAPPPDYDSSAPPPWFRMQEETYQWPPPASTLVHQTFVPNRCMQHCCRHNSAYSEHHQPSIYSQHSSYRDYVYMIPPHAYQPAASTRQYVCAASEGANRIPV